MNRRKFLKIIGLGAAVAPVLPLLPKTIAWQPKTYGDISPKTAGKLAGKMLADGQALMCTDSFYIGNGKNYIRWDGDSLEIAGQLGEQARKTLDHAAIKAIKNAT